MKLSTDELDLIHDALLDRAANLRLLASRNDPDENALLETRAERYSVLAEKMQRERLGTRGAAARAD